MGIWSAVAVIKSIDDIGKGIGDWVANGTPSNIWGQAIQRRYRDQCDSYSNAPSWLSGLISASPVTGPSLANLCDPWLESQGSGPPASEVPFTGGQCNGIFYTIRINGEVWSNGEPNSGNGYTVTSSAVGPVSAAGSRQRLGGGIEGFWTDANGPHVDLIQGFGTIVTPGSPSVFRNDGQPDECGDPPSEIKPNPNPRPDPELPPEEEPRPGPTGEPVFPMPEIPNPFGDPLPVPDFGLPFPFGGAPEGAGQPFAPDPPKPADPIDGEPGDGGDTDFGDPPEGERWCGCCIDMVAEPIGVGSFPAAEPDRIYPSVAGNARLIFGDVRQLDTPIQIRARRVCLWEGVNGQSPTGCRVNVAPGFSYTVTPYSVPIEPEQPPAIV